MKSTEFRKTADIFLIGLLSLYWEMMFIRLIPSFLHVFAYFSTAVLITAFLGLGLGCLLTQKRINLMNLFLPLVLSFAVLLQVLSALRMTSSFFGDEYLLGFYLYQAQGVNFIFLVCLVLVLNTAMFVPLGQKLGLTLKYFKPLTSYSINILGSIAGIAIFSMISFLMLKPVYWFLVGIILTFWFLMSSKKQTLVHGLIAAGILISIGGVGNASIWSPYYKIDLYPVSAGKVIGYNVFVNNVRHQFFCSLNIGAIANFPKLKHYKDIYEFPYRFIHPGNVLILGAGSGNDTAAALRMGIKEIYAVEIDPCIAQLGRTMHEEKPYASSNVTLVVDDARSFMKNADKKFDLITFGYLNSQRALTQLSNVRLDSFLYTKESFEGVKKILSPNGIVAITYPVFKDWIGSNMDATLKEVFGKKLKVFEIDPFEGVAFPTLVFLAGPGVNNMSDVAMDNAKSYSFFDRKGQSVTDDWPYLYLNSRILPFHYVIMLSFMLILSFLSVFFINQQFLYKMNPSLFFLGAGFMMLETVSITRFALLYGSTWVVNSVVVSAILLMIFLANRSIEKIRSIKIEHVYFFLALSILINWLFKAELYLFQNRMVGAVLSSLVLSLPIFFASMIFALLFKKSENPDSDFASNLLGAVTGGLCEYISMITGIRLLFLLALLMYFLSYVFINRKRA